MDNDFKHFVIKIWKRVKDNGPAWLSQTTQKFITSSGTMELVGLDLQHLDTCVMGFRYLLAITDILPSTPKYIKIVTKEQYCGREII